VRVWERESVCVCGRESVCVCVGERECVCVWERECVLMMEGARAVCCSVLKYVAVCCSVLSVSHCDAVCCYRAPCMIYLQPR